MDGAELSIGRQELEAWSSALRAEVERHRQMIDDLTKQLAQSEERLNLVNRLLELDGSSLPTVVDEELTATPPSEAGLSAQAKEPHDPVATLEDGVERVLEAVGVPTHISRIRAQLINDGIPIPGRGEDANVIVRISADERFCRTSRGTYALTSWGIPAMMPPKRRRKTKQGGTSK